ncbi:MAG: ABC transporter substrate-binding protein [Microcoleus sp. PH2017_10_PVI_O_A]|uniref:ABC transporter ATP-binding/substrate-binding protein n=1 Tax=unclassified Microcoleus TaxID=2642155 RepID=UPI001D43AC0F|nr:MULTISPECIES: nitrate ABC transporter ATP-binding protein [unclassified Microcoleus]TAE81464.1 MAG: ATP-binding cassette domain-containing protein [Oscillatoriales cyanobacterium]MCC3407135.1 ABC transporter substrate-binding protein [Microcoleus sp. PH2017_10_PVI_O_A]MCC3461268.1 ABC transporter substrate-binding protein [Microcoleus sp. PH2017_11_PCY_U_A]MCC3479665.1 ABC transporter substrate-binding protein [Microcoleus sp. PH2017_12_PCY_D_A]MCC3531131.1 ABC transporter substrate-binding
MSILIEVDHVDRVFNLPNGEQYIALKNIELKIKKGEFITLIGHSGCGKSTLLNIIAGLDTASQGGITLEGREVRDPGPDRMVVFQNYSLLPWLTVRENIALAVDEIYSGNSQEDRELVIEYHIKLVGLGAAANKRPGEISGGMKQRVAIARALAIRPKLLLLDEPFGALDALTRGGLQDQLMNICEESKVTSVMVTHDVDEALLLSDRIVMLTNGPEAQIGQILEVDIPRPRKRMEVVNHPSYYALRNEMVYFLNQQKRVKQRRAKQQAPAVVTAGNGLEKINLDIGFIPLTDCAPLVVAKEKGFFQAHGLEEVTLSREPSWKEIAKGIGQGRLDAAQMVAGMPIAMLLGLDGAAPVPVNSALTLSRNGNSIIFGKHLYDQGIRTLKDFKAAIAKTPDRGHTLGMVHSASMHNLLFRYWLAAGGIDPDRDVALTVIPPAQMVSNLKAGNIDGYCAGDPWNSKAVNDGTGFAMARSLDILPGHIEKVLGVSEDWAQKYPQTHVALVKALLEACEYCDDRRNREEILELICQEEYIGADPKDIRPGFLDPYNSGTEAQPEMLYNFNQFYVDQTNCPDRLEMVWVMAQMARWGLIPFPKNWVEVVDRVLRPDVFGQAVRELGLPDIAKVRRSINLFDGTVFNLDDPIDYLEKVKIKRDFRIEEILIEQIGSQCSIRLPA